MAQMNVSIPEALKAWVESRVAEGRYSSSSDYIRDLVRRDQEAEAVKAREIARLRAAWDDGLASGEPEPMPEDWADDVIARGRARLDGARREV
ncbi:type II toxin-antitoxin system ParD family antitoxin [Stakelama tenebrarum]|uniref:Type II toxin-antitoxin system ParD family antitoxin n=1 Tax=Stakelama tenebrarum TaxID=2711215 RepID=A0A6G6Y250_9SPHN|nr:type II toxin-antitoxin system ParD family antitoxin [Sphingosinithalassobacter tenebrarum]QIG78683.1 type II toxin-antitoxin system ParD family antitoxin [Sphingosinithalassobacter tenebrarum]